MWAFLQGFDGGTVEGMSVARGPSPTCTGCCSDNTNPVEDAQLYRAGTDTEIITTILVAEQCTEGRRQWRVTTTRILASSAALIAAHARTAAYFR